jgi:hypothetical protein
VGGAIECREAIRAGNGIEAGGTITSSTHLDAGWGIRSQGAIRVGGAIRAGESISAAREIRAGEGYGIYAGLDVRADAWEDSARVQAAVRPADLRSGWWAGTLEEPRLALVDD